MTFSSSWKALHTLLLLLLYLFGSFISFLNNKIKFLFYSFFGTLTFGAHSWIVTFWLSLSLPSLSLLWLLFVYDHSRLLPISRFSPLTSTVFFRVWKTDLVIIDSVPMRGETQHTDLPQNTFEIERIWRKEEEETKTQLPSQPQCVFCRQSRAFQIWISRPSDLFNDWYEREMKSSSLRLLSRRRRRSRIEKKTWPSERCSRQSLRFIAHHQ